MFKLGRLISWLIDSTTVVGAMAVALMMLHVSLDVVARYIFNTSIPGTMTLVSYYYMIVTAFIPLAYAEQKDAHISVEVLTEHFPKSVQNHLAGWMLLLSTVIFGLLTTRSWQEAVVKMATNASISQGETTIIIWPAYYILPLGFALMTAISFYKFIIYLFRLRSGLDVKRASPDDIPNE